MLNNLIAFLILTPLSVLFAEETFQLKLSCSPNPKTPDTPCPPNARICFKYNQTNIDNSSSNCMESILTNLKNNSLIEFNFDLPEEFRGVFSLIIETWNDNHTVDRIAEKNWIDFNDGWKNETFNGVNTLDYSYRNSRSYLTNCISSKWTRMRMSHGCSERYAVCSQEFCDEGGLRDKCCQNPRMLRPKKPEGIPCKEGWEGTHCEKAKCTPTCVKSSGYCHTPNTCICQPGWTGADCTQKDEPGSGSRADDFKMSGPDDIDSASNTSIVQIPSEMNGDGRDSELPLQNSTFETPMIPQGPRNTTWTGSEPDIFELSESDGINSTLNSLDRKTETTLEENGHQYEPSLQNPETETPIIPHEPTSTTTSTRTGSGPGSNTFELTESDGINSVSNSLDPKTEIPLEKKSDRRKSESEVPLQNSALQTQIIPAEHANANTTLIISICVTIVLVSLVIGGVVMAMTKYFMTRKVSSVILSDTEMQQFLKGDENSVCISNRSDLGSVPYDAQYEIGNGNLSIDVMNILESGTFGIVFQGICEGRPVAVKTVRAGTDKEYLLALLSELKVLIYLKNHPNLVSLVGAQTKDIRYGKLFVVVELCTQGSLEKYISNQRDTLMKSCQKPNYENQASGRPDGACNSNAQLLRWGYQICLAMEYLESMKVIHSDLATRNVLLTETLEAKVSDFGLSRKLYQYDVYVKKHKAPLPWRWMAIESLQRKEFSHKSDCWSFGVTLWEIFSLGDTPYHGMEYTLDLVARLSEGMRLNKPPYAPENMFVLMRRCWNNDPGSRPTFSTMKTILSESLNNSTFLYEENHLTMTMELDRSEFNYDGLCETNEQELQYAETIV